MKPPIFSRRAVAIRSSSLEGTYATPKELLLFELDPRESKSERDPTNDHREVFNYRRALDHGTTSELPLSLRLIKVERFRDEYIANLFRVSTHADWDTWIEFCLRGTVIQAKETIERCERLRTIRDDYMQRLANVGGSVRLNQIVEDIFNSPFVRIADLHKRLDVTYPTAKADVDRLVQANILEELPNISPKTFFAPKVFRVAYEKLDND